MNLLHIYSTPIWESSFPYFEEKKEKFLQCVQNFYEQNPTSIDRSHVNGGYHSPMNFTKEPEFAPLFEYVAQMGMKAAFDLDFVNCDVFLTAAWVNIMNSTSCMQFDHIHQDTFSGVFYLQSPTGSGNLAISNPGINSLWQGQMLAAKKNKFTSDKININPTEGSILLWPSYLTHSVSPNECNDIERISISFNIICIPKDFVEHTK